jgi:hypothetical protein
VLGVILSHPPAYMDESPKDGLRYPNARSPCRTENIWAIAVLAVAGWFYLWTATSAGSPLSSHLQSDDLYNRLADGFLAGQLSLPDKPNPALANLQDPWDPAQNSGLSAFHDVSYFNGRYYLYFGAAPAVVLLAPWKALTGTYLGQNVACAIFSWLGVAASTALVFVLRRRHFPALKGSIAGVCTVAIAFGNFAAVLLRRPVFYELAISSAYAFAMAALLCVAMATGKETRRRLWLALAGASYGLVLASRPNYLFGCLILAVPFQRYWHAWRNGSKFVLAEAVGDLCSVAIPFSGLLAVLLRYNHQRFGQWLEFGQHYQLSGLNPQKDLVTTLAFLPVNLWFYFLAPAQLSAYFPFVQVIHMPWFHFPAGYTGEEDVYGICNMPFYFAVFLLIGAWRDKALPDLLTLRAFALGTLGLFVCNLLVISRIGGASNRYMVDLFPPLLPLACLGVFWLEGLLLNPLRRSLLRVAWIGALSLTAAFNILVSLNHNDLLKYYNPGTYRSLAHAFDHVSSWFGETAQTRIGPIRARLRFPLDKVGQLEPLVVTGVSFKADFIYVYYTDSNHVQFGFEHTSYGGDLTKPPIELDYASEHVLEIDMGSLYPPVEHPYYDRVSASEVSRLKKTLRVSLDGRVVLAGAYEFYDSSPGDVSVGRNPVSDAFGRNFSGQLMDVTRTGLNRSP